MSIVIQTQPVGLGYYDIDNRAAGFGRFEADTYTCTHCQAVVVMNPERKRERYKCRGCSHHICDPCAVLRTAGEPCKTYAQKLNELFELESSLRPFGLNPPSKE